MTSISDLQLPSPPQAALRLIELCGDRDADIREIVEVISVDASLTVRLLRVANSAYYSQGREVATLSRAVIVLGTAQVKVVALGFHLAELTKSWQDPPINLKSLWQGSVLRACLGRQIAFQGDAIPRGYNEEAFLVGLLEDFAVPIIARTVGEAYSGWLGADGLYTTEAMLSLEAESAGEDHSALAGRICEHWNFPSWITYAIQNHHKKPPHQRFSDRAAVLWQIAYFVGAVPFNRDQRTAPVPVDLRDLALTAFNLDPPRLGRAFYAAVEDYGALRPVFDGLLPSDINIATLMCEAQRLVDDIVGSSPQELRPEPQQRASSGCPEK